jgi:hypothetical protein
MTLTNEAVLTGVGLLRTALEHEMPAAVKLDAIRLARRLGEEARAIEEVRRQLIWDAAERDPETGEPAVASRDDATGAVTYRLRPDAAAEAERQWRDLRARVIELPGARPLHVAALAATNVPGHIVLALLELGLAVDRDAAQG